MPRRKTQLRYFQTHRDRLDYGNATKGGQLLGSGVIESTCRQYQCRFKRPGQFWSRSGDEALMCLETFWRNRRWHLLFFHSSDLSKNRDAPIAEVGLTIDGSANALVETTHYEKF